MKSKDQVTKIYGNHTAIDVEAIVRRSEIELASYELKQGCLLLEPKGKIDEGVFDKVINTICAIASNGPNSLWKDHNRCS